MANQKCTSPSWKAVKAALESFDRAGLLGLVQDLYAVDKDNQAFLHARLGLGSDQLVTQPVRSAPFGFEHRLGIG